MRECPFNVGVDTMRRHVLDAVLQVGLKRAGV